MPILIISRLTIREAQRRRLLWVALIMGLVFLVVFGVGFYFIQREFMRVPDDSDEIEFVYNLLLSAGMYATNLLVTTVAVLISVTTISGEIESHTIDAIVTKPIPRWQVVLGKWLGFVVLILAYLLFLSVGLILLVYLISGYQFERVGGGLAMIALGAVIVLSLSIAGGTRLSTLANGVMTFMLFAVAFLGGLVEQIGSVFQNEAAVNIGIITSLILPSDALWKKALANFQPASPEGLFIAGPFTVMTEPSNLLVIYSLIYLLGLLLFALRNFSRRDL